jgi:hypothetical protein
LIAVYIKGLHPLVSANISDTLQKFFTGFLMTHSFQRGARISKALKIRPRGSTAEAFLFWHGLCRIFGRFSMLLS